MRLVIGLLMVLFVLAACTGDNSDTASREPAVSDSSPASTESTSDPEPASQETPPAMESPDPAAVPVPEPEPLKLTGMEKTVQVGDLLFGAQPTPEALAELKARGYRTVLTTRGDGELKWDEKEQVESLGMDFVSLPMPYPIDAITDEQVEQFAQFMESGQHPMVLHCGSGNRVAGLWGVWLVERQGMDPAQALVLAEKAGMTRIRPVVEKRLGAK